jgi:hypothetical protein
MPRSARSSLVLVALASGVLPLSACGSDDPPERETAVASAPAHPAGTFAAGPAADHHFATDSLVVAGDRATWYLDVWRRPTGSGPIVESRLVCEGMLESLGAASAKARAVLRCNGNDPLAVEYASEGNPYLLEFDSTGDAWVVRSRNGQGEAGLLPRFEGRASRRPSALASSTPRTSTSAGGSVSPDGGGTPAAPAVPSDARASGIPCGEPSADCSTDYLRFAAQDLGFTLPAVWPEAGIATSQTFYAVIVRSVPLTAAASASVRAGAGCAAHPSEEVRLELQAQIPDRKVFVSREGCQSGPLEVSYTNVNPSYNFLAVYAGTTEEEAAQTLARVKRLRGFADAALRRMEVEVAGDLAAAGP